MNKQSLRIFSNVSWPDEDRNALRDRVQSMGHSIQFASSPGPRSSAGVAFVNRDDLPDEFDIAYGQPPVEWLLRSNRLRWIQITSAGYTKYDRDDFRSHCREHSISFTNASSVLADPCAQHVLAFMLAGSRQMHSFAKAQNTSDWSSERHRPSIRILDGDNVLIVGFGSIAKRLVELLRPMNCKITGVRTRPRGDEPVPTKAIDRLNDLLPDADHIINLLPAANSTKELFDETQFALMRHGASFYNIGRGSTIRQDALVDALTRGHLRAAYLDVTTPEPLPADHPLWTTPNCYITPHIGGAMQEAAPKQIAHFRDNLQRFTSGEPQIDRIF